MLRASIEDMATNAATIDLDESVMAALSRLMAPKIGVGSYGAGVVLLTVPSQQYLLKHVVQTSGTVVPVFSKLRDRMAQPTQVGHVSSAVPLPMVATLYPLRMMASRYVSFVVKVNVDSLL